VTSAHSPNPLFGNHISAARWRCALKCLHVLDNDQGLLAYTPPGTRVPQYFLQTGSKIGLKFSIWASVILGERGGTPETLSCDVPRGRVKNLGTTFGGGSVPPIKFRRAKNVMNLVRFRTTLDFDGVYLWNGFGYQQRRTNSLPFRVEPKMLNFGPLAAKFHWLM